LTISTVGFKTDGPASEQLTYIAQATGGLFVGAANADQAATRLIAVQNIDAAKKALTADGIDGIGLGQSLDAIRMAHPDFPDGSREGRVVVVYVDCDFGFVDGTLDSIAPHDGGHTIDGVTRATELSRVSALYGEPVMVDSDKHVVIYRADSGNTESVAGFRVDVDRFAQNGSSVTGTVKTIVLCRCKPMLAAASVDPELFWAVSEGSGGYCFTTPSGEWRCAILQWGKTATAGCQPSTSIDMPVAGAPMAPNDYDGSPAMPNAIVIDAGQPARFAALGQAVYWRFGGPARVLEYGETLSVMGFTCNVQESGVSCREDATGNGFSFSADGYKFDTPQSCRRPPLRHGWSWVLRWAGPQSATALNGQQRYLWARAPTRSPALRGTAGVSPLRMARARRAHKPGRPLTTR
jgi:hypothetical protein